MKRISLVIACALGLWSADAFAQMPPGSYTQTCRDIRFDGSTLSAVCATAQGMAQRSALRVDSCSGPIANLNGQLACPGGGRGGRPPQGPAYGGGGPSYQGGYERGRGRGGYDDDDDDDRSYRRGGGGPGYGGYPSERPPGGYGPPQGYGRPQGPPPGYGPPQQAAPPPAAPGIGLPPGSWQATCVKPQMQGTTLVAACRNTQGGFTQSAVDVRNCRAIANMNGRLVCG
jgi:hypothetical protein